MAPHVRSPAAVAGAGRRVDKRFKDCYRVGELLGKGGERGVGTLGCEGGASCGAGLGEAGCGKRRLVEGGWQQHAQVQPMRDAVGALEMQ